jgi:hypothetical protein
MGFVVDKSVAVPGIFFGTISPMFRSRIGFEGYS